MANPSKLSQALCMVLLITLLIHNTAECSSKGASQVEILHRKLLLKMKEMALKNNGAAISYGDHKEMPEDWELRRVPAGPDPLHHNGRDPNKPKTP